MTKATENQLIPLSVRIALADAALAYANALVDGDEHDCENRWTLLKVYVEDARICARAAELGMA